LLAQESKINKGERGIISTEGNILASGTFCREDSSWHWRGTCWPEIL